jgi:hypothetical protein
MRVRQCVPRAAAVTVSLAAVTTLFGCQSAAGPPARHSSSTSPATTSSAGPGRAGKPSLSSLQSALATYFADQHGLSDSKAKTAARCAVHPTFQELSRKGLKHIVHQHADALSGKNAHSFHAVVKECVTAAK